MKFSLTACVLALAIALPAHANSAVRGDEGIGFYIGIDGQATLASGTFAGQANPNAGRLTWLLDHGDHYHGIGTYSYTGTAAAPVVMPTNANNRLPEPSSRVNDATSAIALQAGTGAWSGSWVSQVLPAGAPAHAYSLLGAASTQSLNGLSPDADVLFNSSGGRWSGSASGVTVALKLESVTAGLKVAAGGNADIFAGGVGSLWVLGDFETLAFDPVFHVDGQAAPGVYSAQFSLVNLGSNTAVGNGGTFSYDFAVAAPVPEPSGLALMLAGLLGVGLLARRRLPR
ncbi:MAG: all3515 family Zur-repressed PEP-CTERM protein [Roseateles sp.]|uniref:all3515 family Zur-repressed PEP-CTERM protein n=1 Tax=Roseateles sp. TaxID=1971397 RepID=UPI0039E8D984